MMNKKQFFAALTALTCMTSALAAMPASAAQVDPWDDVDYVVTKITMKDEKTVDSILVQQIGGDVYEINEEMTHLSAALDEIPNIGDILDISTPKSAYGSYPDRLMFETAEDVEITNLGNAEEICEAAVLTITDLNYVTYTLEDASGNTITFENDLAKYEWYTRMNAFDVGDTVEFLMMDGVPVIPASPTNPFSFEEYLVIDSENMLLTQLTPSGAAEAYASEYSRYDMTALEVASYTHDAISSSKGLFDTKPQDGDIVRITGLEMIMETYPSQMDITKNMTGEVLGSAEELCEVKPLMIRKHKNGCYILVDAQGEYYYYNERGLRYLEKDVLDAFSEGDSVDCLVYDDIVVKAIGASEEAVFPVQKYAVVQERENRYVVRTLNGCDTFHLSKDSAAHMLADGHEMPKYGDVIGIQGNRINTELAGTNQMDIFLNDRYAFFSDGVVTNLGSVYDNIVEEEYTVTNRRFTALQAETADGKRFTTYADYLDNTSAMKNAEIGDTLIMLTFEGYAVIPVDDTMEFVASGVLGDVNNDGTLNILDIVVINKSILTGTQLPALGATQRDAVGFEQCDFNGNGTIDADDALGMLKKIIGL